MFWGVQWGITLGVSQGYHLKDHDGSSVCIGIYIIMMMVVMVYKIKFIAVIF